LKILYFSRDYTIHDQRFLSALAQTEHQVAFLRLEQGGWVQPGSNVLDENSLPPGIEAISWAGGRGRYGEVDKRQLLSSLESVLGRFQPDLVQAGPLHLSANLVAHTAFSPLVSMSWGYDLLYDAPRSQEVQQAIRFTLSRSAAMVGDCKTIRQLAISYGMPDERIVTFPWGVDLDYFSPRTVSQDGLESDQPFRLLSTRGWEPIYGVELIARAFVQAARRCPALHLVMLGSGSQAGLIRQILQDGGVLDRVQFPGQVGLLDLPGYYQSSDVYLSATHSDGTSISLLEALACAKPVIVSDIPGNREWIEPGVQGWWFPDSDAPALAEAILLAYQQREQLAVMGRAARLLAEQRADWNKNFLELFKAYQIALNVEHLPVNVQPTNAKSA
jgi:glycosyltransferase involved in cell wall biosynthesis